MHDRTAFPHLARAAFTGPLVDAHAHNLLKHTHRFALPLEGLVSEASGHALHDAVHTVALHRATVQLAKLFRCEPTFDAVKKARDALNYDKLCELCFKSAGIMSLLLDDGAGDHLNDIKWHDRLVKSPSKRIIRLEGVAQKLARQLCDQGQTDLKSFSDKLESVLVENCQDPQVAAFKSVVCYGTGLNIGRPAATEIAAQYEQAVSVLKATGTMQLLNHKALNDYIVRLALQIAGQHKKPVQFHTGLGDHDLKLVTAAPSLMQLVIEDFPQTMIVLLHSSYPSTRHAGYLASVYKNVYVDCGEVFPMVSAEGQRTILRQILEMTPTNKIMCSTTGRFWPDLFYLAATQIREAFYEVLSDIVAREEMSEAQAISIVEHAMFHNANSLYGLNLSVMPTGLSVQQLGNAITRPRTLDSLAASGTRFVRVCFNDYCGITRYRVIPIQRLQRMVAQNLRPGYGLIKACFGVVRGILAPGLGPVGEGLMVADLRSLRICQFAEGHAIAMGSLEIKEPISLADGKFKIRYDWDPRTALHRVVESAKEKDDVTFLVGFEVEFTLLRPEGKFPTPVNDYDYCVTAALKSGSAEAKILDEIADALEACGIEMEQFHAEVSAGQYEVVTAPMPPVQAVDALIVTREIVYHVAAKHGLQATFSPRLFDNACGTAMHMHVSIKSSSPRASTTAKYGPFSELEASFLQSILDHLPSICAFTLPSPHSYYRMLDGIWAGGTYVAWGRENRETPMRLCGTPETGWNFEMKALDGTSNPYLAIAAVLYSGLLGVRKRLPLRIQNCLAPPATLSDAERGALGITERMSLNLEQAIDNLRQDGELNAFFGEELVSGYIAAIELRRKTLLSYSEEDQKEWMAKFY